MWDSVKAAAKNLGRKKLRSSLTILGITIGVASVILIGNIGQGGTRAVNAEGARLTAERYLSFPATVAFTARFLIVLNPQASISRFPGYTATTSD